MHEVPSIGSHLPPYRRRTLEVQDDAINKLVLKSLDDALVATEPGATRTYLSVRLPPEVQELTGRLDEAAFAMVLGELRRMPQRNTWHRIVLATPAWRRAARDGLGGGVGGLGLFTEPLCQGDIRDCDTRSRPPTAGVPAKTPTGETEAASRYLAPFLIAKIRILDPATLEVLDTQEIADHEKLFDPDSGAMDMNRSVDRRTLALHIVARIEASAQEAIRRSELRGRVDVHERGEVPAPH
ncbi:MAG TPA: hypothetical protein VFJ62_21630 [Usitatibacter sp.]|nr:hypothetical protein [Usitatibacter sp.]